MILLGGRIPGTGAAGRQLVLLFGRGLIGNEVVLQLVRRRLRFQFLPFHWGDRHARDRDTQHLLDCVDEQYPSSGGARRAGDPIRIAVVWAAGRGGFASKEEELASEMEGFESVLGIAERLHGSYPHCAHAFHLTSSAGGLFEGQTNVGPGSVPRPSRAYGRNKQSQECRLRNWALPVAKFCYRPSSVYGVPGQGLRSGLISTLLLNALWQRETRFFGRMDTLRDYVSSTDLARFVADQIVSGGTVGGTFTLAVARPTSLYQLKILAERTTGRQIYASFEAELHNSANISFLPSSLPANWYCRDVETGMRQIYRTLLLH